MNAVTKDLLNRVEDVMPRAGFPMCAAHVAKALGLHPKTARDACAALADEGRIIRHGEGKTKYYFRTP